MAVTEITCEMPGVIQLTEGWQMLNWRELQRNVYRLQRPLGIPTMRTGHVKPWLSSC